MEFPTYSRPKNIKVSVKLLLSQVSLKIKTLKNPTTMVKRMKIRSATTAVKA
jgi:hypothetical protein